VQEVRQADVVVEGQAQPGPARAEAYSEAYSAWLCCQKALTPEAFPALARMRK
jgi:hypothetical protein